MLRKEKDGIVWLEFSIFADYPKLRHGVLLRHGGASKGAFASLNLAYELGDEEEAVKANLAKVQDSLGLSNLVFAKQVHGTEIEWLEKEKLEASFVCDAFLLQEKKITALIKHADCQAAIFYDPVQHVAANVHAGWRGNVQNIYQKTLDSMQKHFHSKAEDILVGISPSLGPDAAEFKNYKDEFPEDFFPFGQDNFFKLWEIAKMQLKAAGILEEHIELAEICTLSHPEDFFSYRREKLTGRNGTFIELL